MEERSQAEGASVGWVLQQPLRAGLSFDAGEGRDC